MYYFRTMIYLDNAGTTKPYEEVLNVFNEENKLNYYNPSAGYSKAFKLAQRVNGVRKQFISYLHGNTMQDKLIFTSGATESNNLAIIGSATNKNKKYLFSMGEHPSVYNCAMGLRMKGYNVDFIPLQHNGQIDYDILDSMMDEDVCFVSTMYVNNETGAVNDLERIRGILDSYNRDCIYHVDAVQGFAKLPLDVISARINLCSLSGHKIGCIKGIGALYISKDTKIKNINYGGGQEFGLRSGTVSPSSIFAFAKAAEITIANREQNYNNNLELKNYLVGELEQIKNKRVIVVSNKECSPYVVSLLCEGNRGETIMRYLDSQGIIVGTGSACSTSKVGNRILENMGYSKNQILGAIRISFGFENTKEDIKEFIVNLKSYFDNMNA